MTNENQKKSPLKKYKFLVPQIVNLGFIGFVCSVSRVDGNAVVVLVTSSIFLIMLSVYFYKFEFDPIYREKALRYVESRKKLPSKDRYGVAAEVDSLVLILVFSGVLSLALLVIEGITNQEFKGIMILVLFVLIAFCIVKVVKNLLFKK